MCYVYLSDDGAKLRKRGNRFMVTREDEVLLELPEESLEGLVLTNSVHLSSQAAVSLLQRGVPTTWISTHGKFFGRLESTRHVDVFRQRRQVLAVGSDFALQFSKRIISAKVHNQLIILRRSVRYMECVQPSVEKALAKLQIIKRKVASVENVRRLMGYEGLAVRYYFQALGQTMPEDFAFKVRSKRPPLDEFNALLSFGYTLVQDEVYTALCNHGLNPYFGMMHALKNGHAALASDLMEEWRAVLIDSMVIALVRHNEIKKEHFEHKEDGAVYLNADGRRIFWQAYEKKLHTCNKYLEGEHSYRSSINLQVRRFADALMADEADIYEPIQLR